MSEPIGTGEATEETLAEKEARLRALLLARMGAREKAPETRTLRTTGVGGSDAERKANRAERFRPELEQARKAEAERNATQQEYFDQYTRVLDDIRVEGSWQRHYNDDDEANSRFKASVGRSGLGLAGYIEDVVGRATLDCMFFSAGTSDHPGQLSTFRIDLEAFAGESRLKGMTIAGEVTAGWIKVFHAGPGS